MFRSPFAVANYLHSAPPRAFTALGFLRQILRLPPDRAAFPRYFQLVPRIDNLGLASKRPVPYVSGQSGRSAAW